MVKKEYTFRVKPKLKKLIKLKSVELELTNSALINHILRSIRPNELDINVYKNKSKLDYDNVQVIYTIESLNNEKINNIAEKHDIKRSQVLNLFLSKFFNETL